MRQDLAKCTTESYRGGRGYAKAFKLKFGGKVRIRHDDEFDYLDEYGGFHSSARHRHWEHKTFTDRLGALKGNIRVNVGRPWDDVYSEFCRVLDRRGLSGYHIWTHLVREVEVNTFLGRNGKVYALPRYGSVAEADGYYVHPMTGILCYRKRTYTRNAWKRRNERKLEDIRIPVPGDEAWKYQNIDGLWFRVRGGLEEREVPYKHWRGEMRIRTETVVVVYQKRSANRKEIQWIRAQVARM